ncbi:glycoside hydrolase family protein [Kutzneria sp. CA-103260]|uniref:glycoside hydrolase family protein n=1 Tax=Kutzneria sp. CA-103260 TaxID=2802641 RepID=UPI001BAC68B9|nr:glycoside hydrolase family protein [Kutzneria sp. CA-103260]QUQ63823.1 sigma-70 family RNA polymerase sigma factor [Kutzneria sp. CA-103260]
MRIRHILIFAAALAVLAATPAQAATTPRKGVSTITFGGASQDIKDVGASWYYNWSSGTGSIAKPAGSEFVPMIWGAANVNAKDLAQAKQQGKVLLGFNEPDLAGQAQMPVSKALDLWPQLQGTGLRLGAPAVAGDGDQAGGWLDQFMSGAASRGYRVDFIPLHWYGSDFSSKATGQLQSYLQAVYNRYHKPIWLTEYALINFSTGKEVCPSQQQQVDFVKASTAMLEHLSFLERYAWFTLSTDGHCSGLYTGTTPNATGQAYRAVG